jgi:hypothetical protein
MILDDGGAWREFRAICEAQGGMRELPQAQFTHLVTAPRAGRVVSIDNRLLARIAKLAGAPRRHLVILLLLLVMIQTKELVLIRLDRWRSELDSLS